MIEIIEIYGKRGNEKYDGGITLATLNMDFSVTTKRFL